MKSFDFNAQEPSELTKSLDIVVATEFLLECGHYMLHTASHCEFVQVYSDDKCVLIFRMIEYCVLCLTSHEPELQHGL